MKKAVLQVAFCASLLCSCARPQQEAQQEAQKESTTTSTAPAQGAAHMDHNPKHGGIFFMAANNIHHLEGAYTQGGTFRLYLYDSYTKPVDPSQVKEAKGNIYRGEYADPPGIPLVLSKDGKTLEAHLGDSKFPLNVTMTLTLPGMDPKEKPDLFNFTFDDYSKDPAAEQAP